MDAKTPLTTAGEPQAPPAHWGLQHDAQAEGAEAKKELSAKHAPQQDVVPPTPDELGELEKMTPQGVSEYFAKRGFGEHADCWTRHQITGDCLILLSPEDVKELGIKSIGDRMGIQAELEVLKAAARRIMRDKVITEKLEAFPGSAFAYGVFTCCGLCKLDEDKYTLTRSGLRIESYDVPRVCGVFKCMCLGGNKHVDNVALNQIKDVDLLVSKQGLCCFKVNKAKITLAVSAGNSADSAQARVVNKEMMLEEVDGEDFTNAVFQAIEEYKRSFKQR